jgi:hypothetical protein
LRLKPEIPVKVCGIKALPPGERWRMNNQFWALFSEPLEDV